MKKIFALIILALLIIPLKSYAIDIVDGDLIRANGDLDVYIVKLIGDKKFKRLILNPEIFNQYGHLKWENIKDVSPATLNELTTSDVVRAVGDEKVYKLYPDGDVGEKRWITTADYFLDLDYDWDAIYTINSYERDFYVIGENLEVPVAPEPEEPTLPREPITINVPADYSTIQAAIDAAISGDTISVAAGTYNENLTIDKGVKLIGESFGNTIIDGEGNDSAITISNGQDILIQKFTIKSEDKYGIYCILSGLSSDQITATFKNNIIKDSGWGIGTEGNCQLTVLNNLIYANKNSSNTDGAGIFVRGNVSYEASTEIRNNVITDNYHGIWAENADLAVLNNIITSNIGGKGTVDSTGIYHTGEGESNNIYNDVWGNGDNYGGDAVAGFGSLVVDPRFVNSARRDYHLRTGVSSADDSPCIDRGHPDFIYYDGKLMIGINYRNDMGAYGGPDNIDW